MVSIAGIASRNVCEIAKLYLREAPLRAGTWMLRPIQGNQQKKSPEFLPGSYSACTLPQVQGQTCLMRDGIRLTGRHCRHGWTAHRRIAAKHCIGIRAKVASPGGTRRYRNASRYISTVDRASRVDSSGEKHITTVSRATGDGIGQIIVEQARMNRGRRARGRPAQILYLDCKPDRRKRGVICGFGDSNGPN